MPKRYRLNLYGHKGRESFRSDALAVLRDRWVRARDSELYIRWQLYDVGYLQSEGKFSTTSWHSSRLSSKPNYQKPFTG